MTKVYIDENDNYYHPACVDQDRPNITASDASGVVCAECGDVIEEDDDTDEDAATVIEPEEDK